MIFIFNYCYIIYFLLRRVNLLSFVCETYIKIYILWSHKNFIQFIFISNDKLPKV